MEAPRLTVIEGGVRSPLGPAVELAGLGLGLTLVAALMGQLPDAFHHLGAFQGLFLLAFAFYGLALLRIERYAWLPGVGAAVLAVALAARVALIAAPPSLSGDLYRYVWEGNVVVRGGDPYRQSPLDPALAPLRDRAIYPAINHKGAATIYPPLAMAGFALVARISPTVAAMKLWIVLHDLLLVLVLMIHARATGRGAACVIAYAWNPLVLVEYAGSGHHDPTAMLWLAVALAAAERRPLLSAVALAAGVMVKLAPLLALPFLLPRWPWRARVVAVALIGAGLAWFYVLTRGTYSGLAAYWGTWRNNELVFWILERGTGNFRIARALSLAAVAAAIGWALIERTKPIPATRLATRVALLTAPVVHPWYLGWELMFQPAGFSAPWLLLSLTAILNYGVLGTPALGRAYHLPLAGRVVEYGLPLALAIVLAIRSRRRRPLPD